MMMATYHASSLLTDGINFIKDDDVKTTVDSTLYKTTNPRCKQLVIT